MNENNQYLRYYFTNLRYLDTLTLLRITQM